MKTALLISITALFLATGTPASAKKWAEWQCRDGVRVHYSTYDFIHENPEDKTVSVEITGLHDPVKQRVTFKDAKDGIMWAFLNDRRCQRDDQ
jgi:hypothetical protein